MQHQCSHLPYRSFGKKSQTGVDDEDQSAAMIQSPTPNLEALSCDWVPGLLLRVRWRDGAVVNAIL